jgi:hypothetical protein
VFAGASRQHEAAAGCTAEGHGPADRKHTVRHGQCRLCSGFVSARLCTLMPTAGVAGFDYPPCVVPVTAWRGCSETAACLIQVLAGMFAVVAAVVSPPPCSVVEGKLAEARSKKDTLKARAASVNICFCVVLCCVPVQCA